MAEKVVLTTPLQKVILIVSACSFVFLSALTASLPLNQPGRQETESTTQNGTENLNTGDTAWVMMATIFGFMSGPVVSYLYANIYGKEEHQIVLVSLITSAFITTLWIIMTFSLVYGESANGSGFLGFPVTYYMFRDVGAAPNPALAPTIPVSLYSMFELSFALITPSIVIAELIDRTNVFGLVGFVLAWHMVIYCPIAHLLWNPNGYLADHDVQDFAGGAVVHVLSSATLVASHAFLTYKKAPNYAVKIPNNANGAFRSVLLLWMLWTFVQAGKAHDVGPVAAQAVVNSLVAVQTSLLVGYCVDSAYDVKLAKAPISMLSHILLGLVGISAGSGYTTVGGAMFTAIVVVLVSKLAGRYCLSDGIVPHDPLDILTIHGIGGTVGFVMTGVTSYAFINPTSSNGLTYGAVGLVRMQVAATLALWGCTVLAVLVLLFICDFVVPISAYTDSSRVFAPPITHATPASPDFLLKSDAQTEGYEYSAHPGMVDVTDDEMHEIQRDASLYRKLSRYFSSRRQGSIHR